MAMDQDYEQMNDHVKGDFGVIGITDNPSALIKWTTTGPEVARIIDEFERHTALGLKHCLLDMLRRW